jgi:hypothetical protein
MTPVERYLMIVDFDLSKTPAVYAEWRSYSGFDGWVLRDSSHWEPLLKSLRRVEQVKQRSKGMILGAPRGAYLSGRLDISPPREDFRFVGYDAGMYFDSYGHYSLLLHHVSRHPGDWVLNEHKLFNRAEDAMALVESWLAWTPEDAGEKETVDPDDDHRPFAIFAAPPLPEFPHQ